MPDEEQRRHLFVDIDRDTRWIFIHIYDDQTDQSSTDFLSKAIKACPFKIVKLLTDNGSQFTDRFTSTVEKGESSGKHVFDRQCAYRGIEQTPFALAAELETTLQHYLKIYKHNIPQRALKYKTPIQALKEWHTQKLGLFVKGVYSKAGLGI